MYSWQILWRKVGVDIPAGDILGFLAGDILGFLAGDILAVNILDESIQVAEDM